MNTENTWSDNPEVIECLHSYAEMEHELTIFMDTVADWFAKHPKMSKGNPPLIHSVKRRIKDPSHLGSKLIRKYMDDGRLKFPPNELGIHVTDLTGVRVMHLHQTQFAEIHELLMDKIDSGDWLRHGSPTAYSWDPESRTFFENLGLKCEIRDTYYTSVHYVVRPRPGSPVNCEIQIRTLFEEIWGEVDHALNYPIPTPVVACREQLRVLSKLVGAGSRLVDSIFRT